MSLMKTLVSFLFILFVVVSTSYSQRVIPGDRVVNHVNVRELPITSSDIVGTLSPGESAELIESISSWYKIRCDDGDIGYVSKSWTKLDDGTSEAEGKDELVIGSWNIKFFGSSDSDRRDIPAIADIVQTMDVMAIQEIKDKHFIMRLDSLVAELNRRGYKYRYLYSDSTGYDDNPDATLNNYAERGGFIWDIDRVALLNPDEKYKFIHLPEINNPVFRVVPISAEFQVLSSHGFDFKMVSVHTVYKKEISWVRKQEFEFIHQWMNAQLQDPDVIEKDIFFIGDFNANPPSQPKAHRYFDNIITDTTAYRIIFNEPVKAGELPRRTTVLIPIKNNPNENESPNYDHILLSRQTSYALPLDTITWASGIIGVIEFDTIQKWQAFSSALSVGARISDHRPIWIKLDYDTEDRD